ncbi:hypothetical protein OV090_17065 [Nannocystis sp. RBIL2]|uniref:hypothetical protein n=1 Tax=Nannocystis sp. RBIL2 TaxID=2996788 RepID=UPI00226F15A0|nr:hypothetical protein [Nannocystis sp. RBIL2]MCY1066493.1 hypothetical protein [Nannocystis sp. RBIL2]
MGRALVRPEVRAAVGWLGLALACARTGEPPRTEAPPTGAPSEGKTEIVEPVGVDPSLLVSAELAPGDVEEKCHAPHYLARCLQARAHPQVRFAWTLVLDEYRTDERGDQVEYTEAEKLARRERVMVRLRAHGAGEIYIDSSLWSVRVVATHPQVREAMGLPHVRMVSVSCAEDDREFCDCGRLRVDQCPAHAFCSDVIGRPNCHGPLTLAGCTRFETCTDSMGRARDPRGVLWQFHSGCYPDQPGWKPYGSAIDMTTGEPRCPGG